MKKIILTSLFVHFLLMASYAQTKTSSKSSGFNFTTASANYLTSSTSSYSFKTGSMQLNLLGSDEDRKYYQDKIKKYRKRQIAGIVLCSIGGAAVAGTVTGSVILARKYKDSKLSSGSGDFVVKVYSIYGVAIGGALLSGGSFGAGIPLLVSGTKHVKKYKKELKSL